MQPKFVVISNDGPTPVKVLYATSDNSAVVMPVGDHELHSKESISVPIRYSVPISGPAVIHLHTTCEMQPVLDIKLN